MESESLANVVFCDVADTYAVTWEKGITCHFTVHPSILPGIRHIVGIFPVDWKSTKDCIACDWSPIPKDYQPDQPLHNFLLFPGEVLRPHADKFAETLFQFCYIDGTARVQGSSRPFSIEIQSPQSATPPPVESTVITAAGYHESSTINEEDFVEIEDEDGEIVIIKSRTAFLQDELKRLESAAKVRETELEREKTILQRQVDDLRAEVVKLRCEKESLHAMMEDSERQQSARLTELQEKYARTEAKLQQMGRDVCITSASSYSNASHMTSSDASRHCLDAVSLAAGAADAGEQSCCFPDSTSSCEMQEVLGAESAAAAADAACRHDNEHHGSPSSVPIPSPGSPSSAVGRVMESSPTGIVTRDHSNRPVFRFPSLREVGLNMVCHFKQSMDQFAAEADDSYDLEPAAIARPIFSAFHRSADANQSPGVIHGTMPSSVAGAAAPVANIECPFCHASFYAGRRPLDEQLIDHIMSTSCSSDRQ